MNWKNARHELPDEDRLVFVRFAYNNSSEIVYNVGKRISKTLLIAGFCIPFVSSLYETYWVYTPEIESDFEKSKKSGLR